MNVASLDLCKELRLCSIDGCERVHEAKGYCSMHYKRFKRTGKPLEQYPNKETHGKTGSSEFHAWVNMMQRCYNLDHPNYLLYGGRGIKVCADWKQSFINFYRDMGDKPSPELTLERIDNERGYEPSNCKWATMKEQSNNTRRNLNYASR